MRGGLTGPPLEPDKHDAARVRQGLAELLPRAVPVELDDCKTLIPIDRPDALAAAVRHFAAR